jgi:pyrroline-5-carboxylate reductase
MTALVVVGGGRMGTALVGGLLAAGTAPADVTVVEADPERRSALVTEWPGVVVADAVAPASASGATGAVVAVKPADGRRACAAVAEAGIPRLLSVMAGVPLDTLATWAPGVVVLRAMPNTPALVGAGISALCGTPEAGADDLAWAEKVLAATGTVLRLPESAFDAVTGLSGSGPAYVFLVAEALEEAGVLVGLPRPVSRQLAAHTVAGAGRLLVAPGAEPARLRADVTSPGGTTAAGLRELERGGVRAALVEAVLAAAARSQDLAPPA